MAMATAWSFGRPDLISSAMFSEMTFLPEPFFRGISIPFQSVGLLRVRLAGRALARVGERGPLLAGQLLALRGSVGVATEDLTGSLLHAVAALVVHASQLVGFRLDLLDGAEAFLGVLPGHVVGASAVLLGERAVDLVAVARSGSGELNRPSLLLDKWQGSLRVHGIRRCISDRHAVQPAQLPKSGGVFLGLVLPRLDPLVQFRWRG